MAQYTYIKNTEKKNVFMAKCHKLNKALVKLASKIFDDEEAVSVINKIMPKMVYFPAVAAGNVQRAKKPGGRGSEPGRTPARENIPWRFFRQQRGVLPATAPLSIKISWRRPLLGRNWCGEEGERMIGARVKIQLQTIHPNPGPGRNKTEEGRADRRERRKAKRKEKKNESQYNIITWNVQRMSLGTFNKQKAK